jgi:molecular chaperone GrpE
MTKKKKEEKKKVDTNAKAKETEVKLEENQTNLSERVEELEKKNEELNDRLIRRLAEFENYKKRTDLEKSEIFKYAAESFIIKVLTVHEDLQRSLSHIDDENKDALRDGLKLVADKFTQILDEQGVKKIKTTGEIFDVDFHEALLQQPSKDVPADTILTEVESGYIYKDKVIKHAKVIVSKELEEEVETKEENNSEE